MNQLLAMDASGRVYVAAHEYLKNFKIYRNTMPSPEIFEIMRNLVSELTSGQTISLPFVGKTLSFGADSGNTMELAKCLEAIKTLKASTAGARQAAKAYAEEMDRMLENPRGEGPPPPEATRLAVGSTAIADLIPGTAAPGVASAIAGLRQVEAQTADRNAGRRRETAVAGLRQVEAQTADRNAGRRRETAVAGLRQVEAQTAARNAARREQAPPPAAPQRTAIPPNVTAFIRLGAAGRRALLEEYGLPYAGNSKTQYDALVGI
jgi:hypothetical protein